MNEKHTTVGDIISLSFHYYNKVKDLEQALTVSRLMTEHYRQLLVDAYSQIGLLKLESQKSDEHRGIDASLFLARLGLR